MEKIVAIQGNKSSGKDETAKFINYLLNTPMCMHNYWFAKLIGFKCIYKKWTIIKYAAALKKVAAILLGVNENDFEDRNFKENYYFDFNEYKLYYTNEIDNKDKIPDKEFSRQMNKGNLDVILSKKLSIRQILQCLGTDVLRRFFGDKLWINITLNNNCKNIIIPDQRFIIENSSVQEKEENSFIIHLIRPGVEAGNHSSEKELTKLIKKSLQYEAFLKKIYNSIKQVYLLPQIEFLEY